MWRNSLNVFFLLGAIDLLLDTKHDCSSLLFVMLTNENRINWIIKNFIPQFSGVPYGVLRR